MSLLAEATDKGPEWLEIVKAVLAVALPLASGFAAWLFKMERNFTQITTALTEFRATDAEWKGESKADRGHLWDHHNQLKQAHNELSHRVTKAEVKIESHCDRIERIERLET